MNFLDTYYLKISTLYPDLAWNYNSTWDIPLPAFKVGDKTNRGTVLERRFVPDEVPVIPTGWLYTFASAEYEIAECRLKTA